MCIIATILAPYRSHVNMAICVTCFIRDTAGALKMHQADVVQYVRSEIVEIFEIFNFSVGIMRLVIITI